MSRPIDARESSGGMKIVGVTTLDDALLRADARIRAFVGDRTFTIWQTQADPTGWTTDGEVISWDVEVSWRVTS